MNSACNPPASETLTMTVVSLSRMDGYMDQSGTVCATIVDCPGEDFDELIYRAAVERAIEKNRIFAGRVQKEKINNLWQVSVPVGVLPNEYKLFDFTCQTINKSIDHPQLTANDGQMVGLLPLEYFKLSNPPETMTELAKRSSPIISILITKLHNLVCIGITSSHGFMDITGHGLMLQMINEELDSNISKSTPIPLNPENLMEKKYHEILKLEGVAQGGAGLRDFCGLNFLSGTRFILNWLWEKFWWGSESRMIFIGRNRIAGIIKQAKEEAIAEQTGIFISTNDILMAWMLKTIYSAEKPNSRKASACVPFSIRSFFGLELYPFNGISISALPVLTTVEMATNPISKTALAFRKGFKATQTAEYARDVISFMQINKPFIPKLERNKDLYNFSNLTLPQIYATNYSACLKGDLKKDGESPRVIGWCVRAVDMLENIFHFHEAIDKDGGKGNFFIKGKMRKSRWNAIEEEVKRLGEGY